MKTAVIGGGSWGTALAILLADKGNEVRVWTPESDVVEDIRANRRNSKYLPDIELPEGIWAAGDMSEVVDEAEAVVLAVPSSAVRQVSEQLADVWTAEALLVNAGKGLESLTGLRLSQVIAEAVPEAAHRVVVLSGPNLAVEVARRIPTATVVASKDEEAARSAQELFGCSYLRVYRSADVIGVELGGALKNVIAIGAGISDGMGFGDNSKAALITRGLVEMMRLGEVLGAQARTFTGLAGVGDLMATCASRLSRNLRVGIALGSGMNVDQALESVKQVAEGVPTCRAAYNLAATYRIYAPITEQLYLVLFEGKSPQDALADLMLREPKAE